MSEPTNKRTGSPVSDLRLTKRHRREEGTYTTSTTSITPNTSTITTSSASSPASSPAPSLQTVDQGPRRAAINQVPIFVAVLKRKSRQSENRSQEVPSVRPPKQEYQSSGWTCINGNSANRERSYQSSGWTTVNDPGATRATPTSDVIHRLSMEKFEWSNEEKKKVATWMKKNQARNTTGKSNEFEELLTDLRFKFPIIEGDSEKVIKEKKTMGTILRKKTLDKLYSSWLAMKKTGAVRDTAKVTKGEGKRELVGVLTFADWTDTWLEADWDGSFKMPRECIVQTIGTQVDEEAFEEDTLFVTD